MPRRSAVFVVDDDPAILAYYKKLFSPEEDELDILGSDCVDPAAGAADEGASCAEGEADDGAVELRSFSLPSELIAAFAAEREAGRYVSLCVLDMRMPEQSGLATAIALREIDPDVAIVVCTAYSDATAATLGARLRGGVFLVQKPFSADAFRLLVHSLVREWQGRRKLAMNEVRLRRTIEATRAGTWEWIVPTGETAFNERIAEIVGSSAAELAGRRFDECFEAVHPEDATRVREVAESHLAGRIEYIDAELRLRRRDGGWAWVRCSGKAIERDAEGRARVVYGTIVDIGEQKALEARILELAIRDPLTGIYNRRYLFERLAALSAEYARDGRDFTVTLMDIDHFKEVNDRYGHQAGDAVLAGFARAVAERIRPYDLLGRYGGEEFVIVSPSASGPETAAIVERVRAAIAGASLAHEGREIRYTFSAGIARAGELPRGGFAIESLIALADKRLYEAKESGRNRIVSS